MPKKTMYQSNPDIYETDLRQIVKCMDALDEAHKNCGDDLYFESVTIELWNMNDYPVGTLTLDEDFWKFTPHNDSDVEVDIDVV